MMRKKFQNTLRGFTLIEILLVVAILGILGTFGTLSGLGAKRAQNLKLDAEGIANFLRDAQQRSITGEDGAEWRINFYNVFPNQDYFELVSSGGSLPAHVVLKPSVEFEDFYVNYNVQNQQGTSVCGGASSCPLPSLPWPAAFERLTGKLVLVGQAPAPYAVRIRTKGGLCPAECRTIIIQANGSIEY